MHVGNSRVVLFTSDNILKHQHVQGTDYYNDNKRVHVRKTNSLYLGRREITLWLIFPKAGKIKRKYRTCGPHFTRNEKESHVDIILVDAWNISMNLNLLISLPAERYSSEEKVKN
jgi:hypothetical protein